MKSIFYLILIFTSFNVFSDTTNRYFQTIGQASTACESQASAYLASGNYWQAYCSQQNSLFELYSELKGGSAHAHDLFVTPCASGYTSIDAGTGECSLPPPLPTDAECLARDTVIHRTTSTVESPSMDETVEKNGCSYTYGHKTPSNAYANCIVAVDGTTLICDATFVPTGATTATDTPEGDTNQTGSTDIPPTKSTSASTNPPVTQNDTPSTGDTTTTQDQTDTTTYSDSVTVTNGNTSITVEKISGGDVTKTTTTTTVDNADGSTSVTTDTTFTQTTINKIDTTINYIQAAAITSSSSTPSTSSSTSSTTTTGTDGSSTTTTTGENGAGERGEGDGDEFGDFNGGEHGELYTKDDTLTFDSVLGDFTTSINNSAVVSSASNFFTVSISGSCPVWSTPAVWVFPSINIDAQCSPMMNNIWPYIAAILLVTASFVAFRWAFL
ncbi:MAG: hypothetical protein KBT51_08870 [Cycloclasticus sp.]|nr:hypothetical protein [Cycloclasticus sp.]